MESLNGIQETLKVFRLEVSKQLNLKAYEIFNNNQLEQIIEIMPHEKEQLLQIKYYSKQQIENYGDQIIRIIKENL